MSLDIQISLIWFTIYLLFGTVTDMLVERYMHSDSKMQDVRKSFEEHRTLNFISFLLFWPLLYILILIGYFFPKVTNVKKD